MSRITGTDAFNMMEAYNAVYAPQELTEEQVWEEVEAWVNSLVEEGHDLSEYTWEDMYEYYINEDLIGDLRANAGKAVSAVRSGVSAANRAAGAVNQAMVNRIRQNVPQGSFPGTRQTAQNTAMYGRYQQPASQQYGNQSRFSGARDAAFAKARQIQGSPVVGPRVAAPSATPARPAAAPTGGVAKPTTTATTAPAATPAAPARTFNPLMQKTFGYQTGYAPSQVKGDIKKMAVMGSLRNSFDPFDIVQGYLIDEGYAETEEAAAVIMANMSEEWRQKILDERNRGERDMSPEAVRYRRDRRDGDTTSGGYKPYVRAGGRQEADHKRSRGVKKQKGKVLPHMRGPNDNVSNYHAVRGED